MNHIHPRMARWALALAAAASLFLQPGCRSVQRLPGQWLALPATADGRLEDFSRKMTSQLFENGMMVGLGNDDRNLYVFFTPDIRRGQRPPGRAVLTLWLDEQGGKAQKLGLLHVSGPAGAAAPAGPPVEKLNVPAMADPPGTARQQLLQVIDRRSGREAFIAVDGAEGPAVRLASDWGDFSYQLRIPFKGAGPWPGIAAVPGREIAIGLQWEIKALPAPGKEQGSGGPRHRGAGRGDPAMGPPPGLEEGGPEAGRGLPGAEPAPASKRKVWLRTVIIGR
jgi:hypothetical protein